ncbi:MAG: alpha/beta hydrolase, partial [Anaerolineaceae bacterium]|nr:alpha/beta hydrolase [Anaerolineaceae bacterium]
AVVYFHGGGFIGGSMAGLENICKTLAFHANAVVVNVEYRLAPEHPFPAAPTDAYDAVKWVHANAEALKVNPDQIAVSGDSAGGNLTIVCALMDRDQGNHFIKLQAPIYPVVNLPNQPTADFAWTMDAYEMRKDQELSSAAVNSLRGMASTFNSLYLQNDDLLTTPYASPYFEENLSGLPEALIFTAEYDFLRPQGEAYGRRLRAAGIPTTIIRYAGIDHGFIDKCGFFPQSEDCLIEIAKKIKSMFV